MSFFTFSTQIFNSYLFVTCLILGWQLILRWIQQWWLPWWRPAVLFKLGQTQKRWLIMVMDGDEYHDIRMTEWSSLCYVWHVKGWWAMGTCLFVFFMEGQGSGLCKLFLFIEVMLCHTKQPSSSWNGHSRPEKSVNLNSSKLRTFPPLTDLVFLFQHPMAR